MDPERTLARWLSAATILACLVLAIGLASPWIGPEPPVWDDAYMFVRYAHNLVTDGALAWDPRGEPTFGLTSPLFLFVVAPVRELVTDEPLRAALLSSLVSGVAFFLLLAALVRTALPDRVVARRAVIFLVALTLAGSARMQGAHMASGMDTMFAMAFVTGWLLLGVQLERAPSHATAWAMGLAGGLAFGVRPDLCLYTLGVPLTMAVLAKDAGARRRALAIFGLSLAGTVLLMGTAWAYFGTPLPLPFWVKGTKRLYDESVHVLYGPVRLKMLTAFVRGCWPVLVAIVAGAWVLARRRDRRVSGFEAGVLLATVVFVVYYLRFALQIMPMEARFYQPVLPALVWLGCRGLVEAAPLRIARPVLAPLVLLVVSLPSTVPAVRLLASIARNGARIAPLSIHDSYRSLARDWFGLEAFSRLPDDLVIATTEVGHVAALNPDKAIVDLSGLNDDGLARGQATVHDLLQRRRPDVIYVPDVFYGRLRADILDDPGFLTEYEYFPPESLGLVNGEPYWLGIALRRSSRHYEAMRSITAPPLTSRSGRAARGSARSWSSPAPQRR